jgi:hypothetical protein
MTVKALKIAFGVLLLATSFSGQALAAAPADAEFSPDGAELCSFVADAGGYICKLDPVAGSLVQTGEGVKKKLAVSVTPIPVKPVVQVCCQP